MKWRATDKKLTWMSSHF